MTRPVPTPKPAAAPPVSGRSLRLDFSAYIIRGEDPAEMQTLTQAYLDQYRPAGAAEEWLLRTMILSQWHKQRWGRFEARLLNSASDPLALLRDPASNALLKMIQRRLDAEDSRHFRSLAELRRLQKQRAAESPAQPKEKTPVTENWVRLVKPPVPSGAVASACQAGAAAQSAPGASTSAAEPATPAVPPDHPAERALKAS